VHSRPDLDGEEQLRVLDAAWDEAARHWQDEVARQFDTDHWTPLAQRSRAYLEALRAMLDVLESAERDTEFLPEFLPAGRLRRQRAQAFQAGRRVDVG
jgi:hypothetical protein